MGDRFSNNLMHDAPGQLILTGGPLTMWDHNEVFNTGYAFCKTFHLVYSLLRPQCHSNAFSSSAGTRASCEARATPN